MATTIKRVSENILEQ